MAEVRRCDDGHRCLHGSRCLEHPTNEGSFYCDCTVANGDYAGLYCEYEADVYCNFPQEVSETWFCANGGTCVADVGAKETNFKCDCQEDLYEGPHCEYVKDTAPDDWPSGQTLGSPQLKHSQKSKDGLAIGVKLVIVLVALIIVGVLVLFIVQKRRSSGGTGGESAEKETSRRKSSMNSPKDPSQALQLESDGHAFQDVVKSTSSTPHSDGFDFEAPESMSVEVERPKTPTHFSNGGSSGGHLL